MDFADEVKLIGKRVAALKDQIQTEEATKMSFIMPFFQLLGYDVLNLFLNIQLTSALKKEKRLTTLFFLMENLLF